MEHKVAQVFFRNQAEKAKNIITVKTACGLLMQTQWRQGMRVSKPGEGVTATNQPAGVCPVCFPESLKHADVNGAGVQAGIGEQSFLNKGRPNVVEETKEGDILGGYTVEGEDQITADGRTGNVAYVDGDSVIKGTEVNHGQDAMGGYGRDDGMGRAVEVNDERVIEQLRQEEAIRQQRQGG